MLDKTSDLHLHLNGSFSMEFLEKTAIKNNCQEIILKLKDLHQQYLALVQTPQSEFTENSIKLVWAKFAMIHGIIQTLEDIKDGTEDVIKNSKAKYLEIRTTPKPIQQKGTHEYIDSFVTGLITGNQHNQNKLARGLLSIDRTLHSEPECYEIVDRVVAEKEKSGMLVGIDICGNPNSPYVLSRDSFKQLLGYILKKDIGLAIHIGESPKTHARECVDDVLSVLVAWYQQNKDEKSNKNPMHGKIRLGHAIFLTSEQSKTIQAYQIPIEICPSCHEQLNWWKPTEHHTITSIYPNILDPVVAGTDDEFIFGRNAKQEFAKMCTLFHNPGNRTKKEIKEHQSQFRFSK